MRRANSNEEEEKNKDQEYWKKLWELDNLIMEYDYEKRRGTFDKKPAPEKGTRWAIILMIIFFAAMVCAIINTPWFLAVFAVFVLWLKYGR